MKNVIHRSPGGSLPHFARRVRCIEVLMRTLAISNYKGGMGKTTTAVNLATIYAKRGRRALLKDLDPQAFATDLLKIPSKNNPAR